ncbi:hypothetical protein Tco_0939755 [Tanacetum coccineum]|uniref:Uncharacterized protein n=1 Tax=Tanacetum coccineum TaxID=301880 RepID=A0ABQ5DL11_9ASTR
MEDIQAFLKKYDHIPPREKCMALFLAEKRFLEVKQALEEGQNQPENKCPIFDDDDEEYTIQVREYYKNSPVAITPNFSITDSLIMEDEHLDTILETESDEENEFSVKDLNLTPSESEDLSDIKSECDVPVCDDFTTFSNPPFDSYDDSTLNDDYDSEGDILEELLNNDSLSLPENESFYFDRYYDPSSPRPPAKPPNDDGIYFDAKPDTGILTDCPDFENSRARGFVLRSLELQSLA